MTHSELPSASPSGQQAIAAFRSMKAAQQAKATLEAEGFSSDQIVVAPYAPDAAHDFMHTRTVTSAEGGAIAGAVFGTLASLLLGLGFMIFSVDTIPMLQSPTWETLVVLVTIGSLAGTAAGGIIGLATGAQVPDNNTATGSRRDFLVSLNGSGNDISRAKDILSQQAEPSS